MPKNAKGWPQLGPNCIQYSRFDHARRTSLIARCCYALVFLVAGAAAVWGDAAAYHQTDFPPEEFKARWEVVFNKIGNQAVAVVQGAPRTNGFIFPRQTNEFYYLSGIETPGSYLLLDGRTRKSTL